MSAKRGGGALNGFLDRGARLEGTLSFDDVFRIDGQFKGTIMSDAELVVGEGGVVEGDVRVGRLAVSGTIKGSVHAKERVELHAGAELGRCKRDPSVDQERSFEHPQREHAVWFVLGDLDERGELLAAGGAVHFAQPRAESDQQHQSGQNKQRAEQITERCERELGQQRFVGKLVQQRLGDARIIRERIKLHIHIVQHSAGVRLSCRRVNQRFFDRLIRAEFLNARQRRPDAEPEAQHKKRQCFIGAAAVFFIFVFFVHVDFEKRCDF